jgi:hypothetical protein
MARRPSFTVDTRADLTSTLQPAAAPGHSAAGVHARERGRCATAWYQNSRVPAARWLAAAGGTRPAALAGGDGAAADLDPPSRLPTLSAALLTDPPPTRLRRGRAILSS